MFFWSEDFFKTRWALFWVNKNHGTHVIVAARFPWVPKDWPFFLRNTFELANGSYHHIGNWSKVLQLHGENLKQIPKFQSYLFILLCLWRSSSGEVLPPYLFLPQSRVALFRFEGYGCRVITFHMRHFNFVSGMATHLQGIWYLLQMSQMWAVGMFALQCYKIKKTFANIIQQTSI